jgi:hypothetical protein
VIGMTPGEIDIAVARLEVAVEHMDTTIRALAPLTRQVIDAEHDADEARRAAAALSDEIERVEDRLSTRIDRSHEGLLREIGLVRDTCTGIKNTLGQKTTAKIGARGAVVAALAGGALTLLAKALGIG